MKSTSQLFEVPAITYSGPRSENALAFKHYNPAEIIDGKTRKEHLRFSIA
jgi:xylose isomerase